jgi:hypothetical protein
MRKILHEDHLLPNGKMNVYSASVEAREVFGLDIKLAYFFADFVSKRDLLLDEIGLKEFIKERKKPKYKRR